MLASLLETPAGFSDQTMVEELVDLLLRYLVDDEWLAQQESVTSGARPSTNGTTSGGSAADRSALPLERPSQKNV